MVTSSLILQWRSSEGAINDSSPVACLDVVWECL